MTELVIIVIAVLIFALLVIAMVLYFLAKMRIKELESENCHKRLRHDTIAGLEDAIAIAIDAVQHADLQAKFAQQHAQQQAEAIQNMKSILADVRNMRYGDRLKR